MNTWKEYKEDTRKNYPEIGRDLDEVEAASKIIGIIIERRHDMELSQRDLAARCGVPQSSIARIESGQCTPNLSTLLKITNQLGLALEIKPI